MPAKTRRNTKKSDKSSKEGHPKVIDITEEQAPGDEEQATAPQPEPQPEHKPEPSKFKKLEEPVSEEPQSKKLVFPYACLKIVAELRKKTSRFIQALTNAMGDHLEENKDFENLERINRRLKNYVVEIIAKIEDKCEFQPNFGKETVEMVQPIDMELLNENQVLLKKLNDLTEQIVAKKTVVEHSFIKDIELALESSILPPDKVTDTSFKIKSKSNTMYFDAFLDKYIESQKQYADTISKAASELESNFESLKVNVMRRFKNVIVEHSKLENVLKEDIMGINEAEEILLRDLG